MLLAALLFVVGALVQGLDRHRTSLFVVARFMRRHGGRRGQRAVAAYISEVAPANIRGRLTTVQQVMIITGLTAAFVVNYFLAAVGRRARLGEPLAASRRGAGCT